MAAQKLSPFQQALVDFTGDLASHAPSLAQMNNGSCTTHDSVRWAAPVQYQWNSEWDVIPETEGI